MNLLKKLTARLLLSYMLCHAFFAFGNKFPEKEGHDSLKILSWNIYMRPTFLLEKKAFCRAELIADTLLKRDYDIVIFQEAFNKKAVAALQKLKQEYPYNLGPVNRVKGKTSKSSGIWLWSKHPFQLVDSVKFTTAASSDKLASKGAVLVQIEKSGQKIQLIGTHLQAIEGVKYRQIRESQMALIKDSLVDQHERDKVPQLILGDLNTIGPQLDAYIKMLSLLDAEDGELQGERHFTYDALDNILAKKGARELLDYALIRANGLDILHSRRIAVFKKAGCWKNKSDLSDHYAMEMEIFW